MVDDIIEAAIDILGDVLEVVVSSKRKKRKKEKRSQREDPWTRGDQAEPWEQ